MKSIQSIVAELHKQMARSRFLNLINDFVLLRFRARTPEDLSAIEVIYLYIYIIHFMYAKICRDRGREGGREGEGEGEEGGRREGRDGVRVGERQIGREG